VRILLSVSSGFCKLLKRITSKAFSRRAFASALAQNNAELWSSPMRRCPVCDFIYEDDEKLCAMDGTGLVNHSGPLPFEESALPQSAAPANSHWRASTLIAAGIILAIALFVFFHSVAKRNGLQSNPKAAAQTRNPAQAGTSNPVVAVPVETATPLTTSSPAFNPTPEKSDPRPRSHRTRQPGDIRAVPVETATPFPRPAPSLPIRAKIEAPSDVLQPSSVKPNLPRPSATPHTTNTNQKKESKIGSFLKKAGRALKKPFQN
jgi:hypothetical protein